ncbi:MAG: acyltransferase [Armatimonadetes bacterium]|nr:acyltransferase [Armatimonadota bacterium]
MEAASSARAGAGRTNNFDFLRFALAALVVFYHSFMLLGGPRSDDGIAALTRGQLDGGLLGVGGFFVISGFLVTGSWVATPTLTDYFKKRVLRIYPAFIVASLFCALVVGPLAAPHAEAYFRQFRPAPFVGYMLLLVGPFMPPVFLHLPFPNAVDGSFWTLRYEFWCYVLVAALGLLGLYRRRALVAALFAGALLVNGLQSVGHLAVLPDREYHLLGDPAKGIRLLADFFAGMTFFLYRDRVAFTRGRAWLALGLWAAATYLLRAGAAALPLFGAYLLLSLAFNPRLKLQDFGRRGDLSYGVYLYSFPIQQLLIQALGGRLTPPLLFLLALALASVLAALSWRFVEAPCLRLKPRRPAPALADPMTAGPDVRPA